MKNRYLVFLAAFMSLQLSAGHLESGNEDVDVAELIIHLAPRIASNLNPPVVGAERVVTAARVSEEGSVRTYYIEGEDVNQQGRVFNSYWIRLSKPIDDADAIHSRELAPETLDLVGPLLNSVYDFAEMDLDHQKVELSQIVKTSDDPLILEISGVNHVCEHVDLNSFNITITRHIERNRPSYETSIHWPNREAALLP